MSGDHLRMAGLLARVCGLAGALMLLTGCGVILGGPATTITVQPLAGEDLADACKFDISLPDEPLTNLGQNQRPVQPLPTETAALVVYERGDSQDLFNDSQVQQMAASLHLVTVFAHECKANSYDDLQVDATKGPGRMLFTALQQYAAQTSHTEIPKLKVLLYGFSAAGVLSTSMVNAYPNRVLGAIPYAAGSAYFDLDDEQVTAGGALVPMLILANAYDSDSGDQRSLRLFQRGWAMYAPWAFGVQNHTDHCCNLSTRDVMIPWVTAIVQSMASVPTQGAVSYRATVGPVTPTVRFLCYTDGWPDAQGELDCWMATASILPDTNGGPSSAWLPNSEAAQAWLTWVTSPGTN